MKKLLLSLTVILFAAFLSIVGYLAVQLNKTYDGPDREFVVESGDFFGRINQRLYSEGFITDARLFHRLAKYENVLTKFKAGSFTIKTGSTMGDVLNTLVYGQPNLTSITIPEGRNMYEVSKLFEAVGITKAEEFLKFATDPELIKSLGTDAPSLEGYLFPETYRFAPNTPAKVVIKTMIDLFNKKTAHLDFNHPFLSKHQVIILASVVEKETGAKFERPAIAGVFTNRLKKKMRLQSDPTTIYGMWHRYNGNIRKKDLLESTPYNTYTVPALPLGPISNPSLEAIQAVLNPEKHDYIFFVSKNDGTHIFTKTYKEHLKAVNDFQKNSKAREGKSWRDLKQ